MYKFEDNGPFNSSNEEFSSSFYKELMDKEENKSQEYLDATINAEDVEYVEVHDSEPTPSKQDDPFREEEVKDAKGFLDASTRKGFSNQVNQILSPTRINDQTKIDVAGTFKELFDDLNQNYGLDIRFDFDSFTNTLRYMINPKSKAAIEVYISEAFGRIRLSLYIFYLNAITLLSQQLLDPKFITSNSMTYAEKLLLCRELFQYIQNLNEIYKDVNVSDSDIKLKKLSEESHDSGDLNSDEVQAFLTSLLDNVRSK